jgi:hypothetical protein
MSITDDQTNHKITIRAKSVESSESSPQKQQHHPNDLAPPSNYNLKSLSIEHRLANISQMSISSQLSKSNSIRHNSRSGACDTPVQHVHSSTPTPRESIVFNRGDEKPIAKILLQQQQQQQITKLNQQPSNGNIPQQNIEQQQQKTATLQTLCDNSETSTLMTVNHRTVSMNSYESNDSELSEYENTTLKSNKTLIKNSKARNLNDSYNNAITAMQMPVETKQILNETFNNNNINNNKTHSNSSVSRKNSKQLKSSKTNCQKCCCVL